MSANNQSRIFGVVVKLFKYLAIFILSLYFLIWIFSPIVLRPILNNVLQQNNIQLSDDSSIRYNPFLTKVTAKKLRLHNEEVTEFELGSAELEIDLHRLLFDKIYVKSIEISDVNLPIEQTSSFLKVAGFEIASDSEQDTQTEEQQSSDLNYTLVAPGITFNNINIIYSQGDIRHVLTIDSFEIRSINANQNEQSLDLDLLAKINEGKISVKSKIELADMKGNVSSEISIKDFEVNEFQMEVKDILKDLSGLVSVDAVVDLAIDNDTLEVVADKTVITLKDIKAQNDEYYVGLESNTTTLNDVTATIEQGAVQKFALKSNVAFGEIAVELADRKDTLLSWDKFNLSDISLEASDNFAPESISLTVASLESSNIVASQVSQEETPALATIKQLAIEDARYKKNGVEVKSIVIDSLINHVLISPEKEIVTLAKLDTQNAENITTEDDEEKVDSPETKTEDSDTLNIKLGSFSLTGENQITFNDQSVSPPYDRVFYIDTLSISEINSQASALSPFEFVGRSNEYAKMNLKGGVNPFSQNVNLEVAGNLQEISLPSISAYIKDSLGFELKSGQLDSDINVAVVESELGGKVKLNLRGIDMTAADSSDTTTLKDQSAIPLNVALGMLKDKKGNIELSIPMKGSVDDPSFGVSSFLILVTKKAAMSQAKSYLMKTFVPYASVISVAMSAGEFALKLRFEDLTYDAKATAVGEKQQQYAQEFIALMKDKPETQVKVCGVATVDEAGYPKGIELTNTEAINTLKSIAKARAESFKQYAVQNGEIESSRILLCNPKVNYTEKSLPRIEISI